MIKHKLKIGDEVRILEPVDRDSYGPGWTQTMETYIGQTAIVSRASTMTENRYVLSIQNEQLDYWWEISNLQRVETDLLY